MLRFTVFTLLVAAASSSVLSRGKARLSFSNKNAILGPVEGFESCVENAAEVLEFRVTNCTSLPCELTMNKAYNFEVDFKPTAAHDSLTFELWVVRNEYLIRRSEIPSVVSPGSAYTLSYEWTLTFQDTFLGEVPMRLSLSGDGVEEVCMLFSIHINF